MHRMSGIACYVLLVLSFLGAVSPQSTLLSSSLSGQVTHVTVGGNRVFVSVGNTVYRFNSTLHQQQQDSVTGSNTVGLATTADGQWLVVCTDASGVTCLALNGSDLTATPNREEDNIGSTSSITVFTAPVSGGESFYTGSYVSGDIRYRQYGFAGSTISRVSAQQLASSSFNSGGGRQFESGFFVSGYAYYVVVDPSGGNKQIRIIRVCNDTAAGGFNNQYELQLGCDGVVNFFAPNILGVSVLNEERLLIGVKSGSSPADVCSYSLSDINSRMDMAYDTCVTGNSGNNDILWRSMPTCTGVTGSICNLVASGDNGPAVGVTDALTSSNLFTNNTIRSGLTAILGLTVDELDFIFLAFTASNSKHYIDQYIWDNITLTFISEVEVPSPVSTLAWSEGSEYVYGINSTSDNTPTTLTGVKIEECSSATSCTECVSIANPLCGWCLLEGKCSRRPFCQDSNEIGRFLTQGSTGSCINTVSVSPSRFVIDIQPLPHQISMTFSPGSPPPKLSGEEYFCVFNNITTPLQLTGVGSGAVGICQVGDVVSQVTNIQLATNFSLYSNRTGVNFYTRSSPYNFYNCPATDRCSECVNNDGVCGWCTLNFTCAGQNSSCINGNWLSIQDEDTVADLCPFLQPNPLTSDGRYVQPVNIQKSLPLTTVNTLNDVGLSYQCVYGNEVRSATANSDSMVTCDITSGQELSLSGSIGTETQSFSLRQVYMGNTYTVEINGSSSTSLNVVLYDCPALADGCSPCLAQNIDSGFQCSWCNSNPQQCIEESVCTNGPIVASGNCPVPTITGFNPKTGPPQGRTEINITGTDLGTQESDIVSVTIGSRGCTISFHSAVESRLVCIVDAANNTQDRNDTISIMVNTSSGIRTVSSRDQFQFITPTIESVNPTLGPASGGTRVTVKGTNLNIGNQEMTRVILKEQTGSNRRRRDSHCPDVNCTIINISSNEIQCTTSPANDSACSRTVTVSVNGAEFTNTTVQYSYQPDPVFNRLTPDKTIPAGGITLTFTGTNLNVIQSPTITISGNTEQCTSTNSTHLLCTAPNISTDSISIGSNLQYSLSLDNVASPDSTRSGLTLTLVANPFFNGLDDDSRTVTLGQSQLDPITITGNNIESVDPSEINITLHGNDGEFVGNCTIRTTSQTEIACTPPEGDAGSALTLRISVGDNLSFPPSGTTGPEWTLRYEISSDSNTALIAGAGGAGGAILLIILLVLVISIPLGWYAIKQSKKKDLRFTHLMTQMETMELEMADQCKQAFAELQTDLGQLVADDSLDMQQLPFHDFPTYATKVFFPSASSRHPVLAPPKAPHGMDIESVGFLLKDFRELVFDKKFLIAFIRTLEAQPKFTLQDKSTMASLLMVSCLKDLTYATEILQALLGDLIRRSLANTRNHPKLLLRRTESVAEKLLTNWFCVVLYPYVLEHAGAPLFVLFKAVKAQLEKGPIDVITGEARNSLSEEKLLRQSLDYKVMECEVEMGNPTLLLPETKRQEAGLEASAAASPNVDDIQTIKLLDTDSVSQTKEKLLDFIYENRPVSLRPSINEVELELCRGNAGIPLKDQDTTSRRDGEWMRINTLGHFNIHEMAEAAIEDPKKATPRFRLTSRSATRSPGRPVSGAGYDVPGTIVASASITSQTSLLASIGTQSFENNTRLFHLVKPESNDGDQKIVSEVFLTRLLSTKRILQSYVDDLFHAIFTIPSGKQLPKAIKVLFDFLDGQAAELNITDPEVLHTWKTNTLPLRFWVNLIKNPDFVFDINKSATVDACFTVIAQAYIDACSTAEVRYTKDTPSARLLYANEVKQYKNEVLQYYHNIQTQPRSTHEELKEYFEEMCQTHFANFESKEGLHFHPDSALLEMYRYAVQYGDEIMETLNEERLTLMGAQFNSLRQKYNVNSSSM